MPAAVYENHSQDTRYTGPLETAPTVNATYGMGGNNQPFVVETPKTLKIRSGCEGGGKGPLVQTELSATLATRQDQSLIQRAAGFDLGNSGGIGYSEECSPTLMTGAGGNKTAVVQNQRLMESLVLNDQGGKNMDVSVNVTGTLRAQTHGHPPVVFQKSEDEGNET